MNQVLVSVSYRLLPDQVDHARSAIAALVATVLAQEPECGGIELLHHADDPTRLLLIERWPSREHFLGPHTQQPHIQAFIQSAGAFLAGPPELAFWNPASQA